MNRYRVEVEGRFYDVEIEDLEEHPVRVRVAGEVVLVNVGEAEVPLNPRADLAGHRQVEQAPAAAPATAPSVGAASGTSLVLAAPLPGVVTAVVAKAGAQVRHGDELLTIEAMKMFNVIRSPRAGTVAQVHVNEGTRVAQGEPLVTFSSG